MRKLFWCCSAAGALALGSLFAASYYGCRQPDSVVGRCITKAANASLALQPIAGLATMIAQASPPASELCQTTDGVNVDDICIPDDPQPIPLEPEPIVVRVEKPARNAEPDAAPIVIHEEDMMPSPPEYCSAPPTIELSAVPNGPENVCPLVMPYCNDDDESAVKLVMPYAENDGPKSTTAAEEAENNDFEEWKKLFEATEQAGEQEEVPAEQLPFPAEDTMSEPKFQEDIHIHEQYSGCPCTICPYTGKSYPLYDPESKAGMEESSEEPPHQHQSLKKSEMGNSIQSHTQGVDTMEYRPSDGGLNEYGRGPL